MAEAISPLNITAAALITQFFIVAIAFVGAAIIRSGERLVPFTREVILRGLRDPSRLFWIILIFSLFTIGCLVSSDQLSAVWRPLFGDIRFSGVPWSTALLIMFVADIALVWILVAGTGGNSRSPFTPVYFIIPALAIFLREPLGRVLFYVIYISISFSLNSPRNGDQQVPRAKAAYSFVSVASLFLATFVGFVTRPR